MIMTVAISVALAGCGATVSNTDKPTGMYIAGAPEVTGSSGVTLSESAPAGGGQSVSGVSCKNKIWDPQPTREVAISVLQREAAKAGYDSVYVSEVGPASNALVMNCWSAIEANGIAFNG